MNTLERLAEDIAEAMGCPVSKITLGDGGVHLIGSRGYNIDHAANVTKIVDVLRRAEQKQQLIFESPDVAVFKFPVEKSEPQS